jgi:single-stranded-DNA-specific exonuclease
VITVDCGITAFAPLAAAARIGLDVIVVDHHEAEPSLPKACAVVDPNRLDESDGFGHLAAVGVAYLLVVAVNRLLREEGWYNEMRPEPDLMQWLDLVALGTVCDVVPLKGLNRAYVAQGLKIMGRRGNAGLMALADVAGIKEKPGDYHLGFILGPRVNAGGRVGRADLGARLLSCDDPAAARIMAVDMDTLNQERRVIEAGVLEAATRQIEEEASDASVLFAAGEGWHPGVIGIVAGRLKERFNKPACIFALDRGMAKGSGRSVPGVDLGAAVIAARQAGLLVNGGGHAMAAGMTVAGDSLDELKDFLVRRVGGGGAGLPAPELKLDGALSLAGATQELVTLLERAAPFGSGNAEPRFVLSHVNVAKADVVGENHVRCFLSDAGRGRLKAIAFRSLDTLLGQTLLNNRGETLHIAGRLRIDSWKEQSRIQLMIDDAAPT